LERIRNLISGTADKGDNEKGAVNAGLRVLDLNVCSIQNKVNELVAQIEIGGYDVVCVTETWLHGDQGWELISKDTYPIKDTAGGQRGQGCLVSKKLN